MAMNTPLTAMSCVWPVAAVGESRAGDAGRVAEHLGERVVPDHPHVAAVARLGEQLVDQDRLGAKTVAAMDDGDVARDVGQVERLLDRGVPAADDHDVLAAVEETVAGGAGRHALAHELLLRGQPEVARRCAGGDDQRVAGVLAVVADEAQRAGGEVDGVDVVEDHRRVEPLGVRLEPGHQVRSHDAVGVGRPVVDLGRGHQLAALRETGDQHRLEVRTRGVYCRGVTGGTGSQDQQAGMLGGHGILAFSTGLWILADLGMPPRCPQRRRCTFRDAPERAEAMYNASHEV